MKAKMTREKVEELAESLGVEFVNLDGLESAIVGYCHHENAYRLVYSRERIIRKLMRQDGMSEDDATEYAEFNILGAYFGETTPVILQEIPEWIREA